MSFQWLIPSSRPAAAAPQLPTPQLPTPQLPAPAAAVLPAAQPQRPPPEPQPQRPAPADAAPAADTPPLPPLVYKSHKKITWPPGAEPPRKRPTASSQPKKPRLDALVLAARASSPQPRLGGGAAIPAQRGRKPSLVMREQAEAAAEAQAAARPRPHSGLRGGGESAGHAARPSPPLPPTPQQQPPRLLMAPGAPPLQPPLPHRPVSGPHLDSSSALAALRDGALATLLPVVAAEGPSPLAPGSYARAFADVSDVFAAVTAERAGAATRDAAARRRAAAAAEVAGSYAPRAGMRPPSHRRGGKQSSVRRAPLPHEAASALVMRAVMGSRAALGGGGEPRAAAVGAGGGGGIPRNGSGGPVASIATAVAVVPDEASNSAAMAAAPRPDAAVAQPPPAPVADAPPPTSDALSAYLRVLLAESGARVLGGAPPAGAAGELRPQRATRLRDADADAAPAGGGATFVTIVRGASDLFLLPARVGAGGEQEGDKPAPPRLRRFTIPAAVVVAASGINK